MAEREQAENVRAFVAIELDGEMLQALDGLQARLRRAPQARNGRWVSPAGIHLTLQFLGDVPAARIAELQAALERACAGIAPFEIALSGLGCFPNLQRPRVLWVGVEEATGTLQRLQLAVERELSRLGFQPEGRAFTPHLTLARLRDQAGTRERAEFGAWVERQACGRVGTMRVGQVCLMQSTLRPEGAIYTRLCTALLRPGEG